MIILLSKASVRGCNINRTLKGAVTECTQMIVLCKELFTDLLSMIDGSRIQPLGSTSE